MRYTRVQKNYFLIIKIYKIYIKIRKSLAHIFLRRFKII